MGRYLWVLLALLILSATQAQELSCQYTINETYSETEKALVIENTLIKKGDLLQISDFSEGEQSTFTVHNPNDYEMFAIFTYDVSGHDAGPKEKGLKLESNNYTIFKNYCYDGSTLGNCSIDQGSVEYKVVRPEILEVREVNVTKIRPNCKMCGSEICLNDGTQCSPHYDDLKCGSSTCNIAGFCGRVRNASCPNGLKNCNDQSCLKPSTKKIGEAYSCDWECESQTGENEICIKNPEQKVRDEKLEDEATIKGWIYWILGIVGVTILIAYFVFYRALGKKVKKLKVSIGKLEDEISKREGTVKFLEKEVFQLQINAKSSHKEILILENDKKSAEESINKLSKKIRHASGKAKHILEEGLRIEENRQAKRVDQINAKNRELSELERKQSNKRSELEEKSQQIEVKKKELQEKDEKLVTLLTKKSRELDVRQAIAEWSERYPNNIVSDEKCYLRFKNSNKPLHVYLYKQNFGLTPGYVIHHIDADPLNNKLHNLISIPEHSHQILNHARIEFKYWKSGIEQLKKQLGMKDEDFPSHIQEHIKKSNNHS